MATSAEPTADTGAPEKTRKLSLIARVRQKLARVVAGRPAAAETQYPPSPFAAWDYEDAADAISEAVADQTIDTSTKPNEQIAPAIGDVRFQQNRRTQDPIALNRAFYDGDHWQYGSGYIGPHPAVGDAAFSDAMTEINGIFTSQNVVREVVDRHAAGVVGKPFRWTFVPRRSIGDQKPTTEEQAAIDAATGLLRNWITARKISTLMSNATATLLLAERSSIRLVVPAGLATPNADGTTSVAAKTIDEALAKVWPEHNEPEAATVVCDDDTKLEAGVVTYEASEYDDATDKETTYDYAWLCFLNTIGETVIRILSSDDEEAETDQSASEELSDTYAPRSGDARLELGGRLTMFEMHRPALITPQVQQAQRALNFALTMVPRNVTTGGFVERLLLDASVPGKFETVNGVKQFVPDKLRLGAGTTNFVQGAEYEVTDAQGEKILTRGHPSAVFRDPVKPDASIAAKNEHYTSILKETGQLHALITGDATASAVSRIQARAEFLRTMLRTQTEVESALTWLLETALAMAEAIVGKPGQYTSSLRCQVSCKLDTGPITPEERKAIEESIGVTISQDTAMLMLDVVDVDAEKSRMADDPASRAAYAKDVGAALQALTTAGASLEGAAKFLKVTPDELTALLTPETYAALPGGVTVRQPKPGAPGEVIEPQDARGEPPAALAAPALDAGAVKGAKPASTAGSAAGGPAQGAAA